MAAVTGDAALYRQVRAEVLAVARGREDDLDRWSPATPAWRVRDVLAHLAGVCDDILHGNVAGVATDAWTAAQVEKRRSWPAAAVLDDWEEHGPEIDAIIDGAPSPRWGQLLFDAWTHEQDLRGALGEPGGRDSAAARRAFDWIADGMDQRDRADGRGALSLLTEAGARDVGVPPAAATVRTTRFELLRAVTGRRSVAQVQRWEWTGEPQADRIVIAPFFHPATDDVLE
jgi:uncharacterized protein (TIGR03083 family)